MNHIYRLIWSQLEQAWVAVAETAKGRGKGGKTSAVASHTFVIASKARQSMPADLVECHVAARLAMTKTLFAAALALCLAPVGAQSTPPANALPTGGKVSAGQASISQAANVLTVQQTSQRAALDWQSFNIGAAATVNFNQPGISSVALNRIIGNDASQIYGKLNANGQVFFSNPNGMLFARGAQVNVGGILASTLRLGNADFMAGNYRFSNPGSGSISNQGLINALGGVTLMGNNVDNSGQINASSVSLVAGNMLAVDLSGDGLIRARVADATGSLGQVVNNSGVIKASGLAEQGGDILLQGGRALNAGSLDASSPTGIGGTVKMLGTQVGVTGNGSINASGASGGGTILLGGDFQGKNPEVPNATVTYFGPEASIKADALGSGNGGKVIVWADDTTRAFGSISAKGGVNGGDGGFVETSGHVLDVTGIAVDARGSKGRAGVWLLDPFNVTVQAMGEMGGTFTGGYWTPSIQGSAIANTTIETALNAGTNVTITTSGIGSELGNITVGSSISKTGTTATTLTLQADNNIAINAPISSSSSALNLVLNHGGSFATATVSGTLSLLGGNVDVQKAGATGAGNLTIAGGATSLTGTLAANTVLVTGGTTSLATSSALSLFTLQMNAGTLDLNTAAGTSITGNLVMSGGTLGGTSAVTVGSGYGGIVNWSGGTLASSSTGSVNLSAGVTTTLMQGTLALNGALNNAGTINTQSVNRGQLTTLNIGTGGSLTNNGGLNLGNVLSTFADNTVTVNLTGTGFMTNGSSGTITSPTANAIQGGAGTTFASTGIVNVTGSTLSIGADGTDTGSYDIASGATLKFTGGTRNLNTGSAIVGLGSLNLSGGTVNFNLTAGLTLPNLTLSGGTLSGTGNVTVSGAMDVTDTSTLTGTGTLTTQGTTTLSGSPTLNGAVTWNNSGTLDIGGANRVLMYNGAVLNNLAGGTINDATSATAPLEGNGSASTFVNSGTFNKNASSAATQIFSIQSFTNATGGVFNVNAGTFQLTTTGTDTGTYNIGAGNTLAVTAGTRTFNGATFTGTGVLSLLGGEMNFATNATFAAVNPTLSLTGGTRSGAGNLTVNSAFNLGSTTFNGVGGGTLDTSGTITLSGSPAFNGVVTWNNSGTVDIGGANRVLMYNGAVLNNLAGGTINDATLATYPLEGNGSASTFVNSGTFNTNASSAATQNFSIQSFTNATGGVFNVNAGTFQLTTTGTDTGTYNIGAGNTLAVTAGTRTFNGATFTGTGVLSLLGGEMNFATNATFAAVNPTLSLTGGTRSGAGNLTVNSAFNLGSTTFNGVGGGTLDTSGTITLSGSPAFNGVVTWNNSGTVDIGGANRVLMYNGAVLNNLAGGTINDATSATAPLEGNGSASTFVNSGTFNKNASSAATQNFSIQSFTNATGGVFNVNAGTFQLTTTGTDTGTYNIGAGNTLAVTAGTRTFNGATFTGTGVLGLTGGTMDFATNTTFGTSNPTLSLTGGTQSGVGNLTVDNALTLGGATFTGTGALNTSGTTTLSGSPTFNGVVTWNNSGTLDIGGANRVLMYTGAVLNNLAGGIINDTTSVTAPLEGNGSTSTFVNSGTFNKNAGSAATQNFSIQSFTNATDGVFNVNAGTFQLTTTGTDTGSYNIGAGNTLAVTADTRTFNSTTFTGTGVLGLTGGTMDFATSTTFLAGGPTLSLTGGTRSGAGNLTVNNAFNLGSTTFNGVGGGTLDTSGTTTLSGSPTLNGVVTWNNSGTLDIGGTNRVLMYTGAVLNNLAGGIINDATSAAAPLEGNGSTSTFVNSGIFNKNAGSAATQSFSTQSFANNGTFNVNAGTFQLTTSGTDTGTYNIGAGNTLAVTAGTRTFNGTTFTGAGVLGLTGGTMDFATNTIFGTSNPTLSLTGGTQSGVGNLTVNNALTLGGATFTGAGALNTSGTTTLSGSPTFNGVVTWNNSGTLDIGGANRVLMYTGAVLNNLAGGIINDATSVTAPLEGNGSTSTFVNSGTFNKNAGSAATQSFSLASAANNGTFNVNVGTFQLSGASAEAGTINVASGATFQKSAGFTNTGTLSGAGTIAVGTGAAGLINQGNINPGGVGVAGALSVTGDLKLDTGSNLAIDLGGTAAGQSDVLAVSGSITNTAGTLTASLLSGYTPANADAISFLTHGSTAPAMAGFSTVNVPSGFSAGYNLAMGEAARLIYATLPSTATFTNASGGLDWSVPGNWSTGAKPGTADTALLSTGLAVTHSTGTDSIAALTINSGNSLDVSGGSLAVSGSTTLGGMVPASTLTVSGTGNVSLAGGVAGAAIGSVINVSGGTLDVGGTATLNELHLSGGSLIGAGNLHVNGLYSQTGGVINKTGSLIIDHWGSPLNLGNITAGAIQLSTDSDINITDSAVNATGAVTVGGKNLNVVSSTAPALLSGATMDVAMTGNITLTGGAAGSNNHADVFSTNGYQTVSAYGITLTGGSGGGWPVGTQGCCGNYAGLFSNGGNQTITVGAGGFTLLAGGDVNDTTATDNFAFVLQNGTTGTSQTITVKDGGSIVVTGGNSAASSTAGGIGSMAAIQAQGDSQLIEFLPVTAPMALGSLTLTGGTTGSGNLANISAINGSQTIGGAPNIKLTGGASGGVDGNGNSASIQAKTSQTITSGILTLTDGAAGVGNSASINAASQTITVNGNLTLNGGGSASGSLSKGGAGIGGFTSTGFGATDLKLSVTGNMTLTSGSVSGAGLVGFNGQTTNITANVGGNITLDPGVGTGLGTLIGAMPGSTAPGLISLKAGGAIALNGQALVQSLDDVTLTATNDILVHDSSVTSGGLLTAQGANLTLSADTAAAVLRGASMQVDLIGTLALTGGAVGTSKYASMTATSADQTITAAGITLTGGASGGGLGAGNFAQIFSPGNQQITVGAGGLHLQAGGGGATETDNFAMLLQGSTTAPVAGSSQTITVNNGGAIVMTGGSSGLTSVGTGHGSRALIESDGASQTIHFTAGGAMNLTGGTAGSRAYASIYTLTGSQTISGAPDITLVGGSGGGIAGEGNKALIWSDLGTQTIDSNSISLTGGSAGIDNSAQIGTVGSQIVSVGIDGFSLTGGSGGNAGDSYLKNYARLWQAGMTGTSQTVNIAGGGHITLQGGSSQTTNIGGAHRGSFAFIRGDGDTQSINFAAPGGVIDITGGTLGSSNSAGIYYGNSGTQSITGAPVITLTGGASGGMASEGNSADIFSNGKQTIDATALTLHGGPGGTGNAANVLTAVGNQSITVGSGGLALAGGAGVVSNHAVIRQKDATATQTITITGGGSVDITGGSSSDTTAATAGSNGDIQSNGTLQTIDFTAGGALTLLGGTVGGGNQAFIRSTAGNQTITGAPSISLTGGATGGIDGEGNAAGISANQGQQTIASSNMTITGGAGGLTNSAYVHGLTQNIDVQGNLALTGGGSSSGTLTGGGAGMGGNGGANATATNLTLNVSGNLTLTGGSVAGASIGSGYVGAQTTDLTINVGGNLTMNPGTVAGVGTRIGTPVSAPAAGTISLTAAGDIALNGESMVHTLGHIALTAGRDILATRDLVQAGGTVTAYAERDIRLVSGSNPVHGTSIQAVGDVSLQAIAGALYVDSTAAQTADIRSSTGNINVVTATGFKNGNTSGYANAAVLSAPQGRWLVWGPDPTQNTTTTTNGGGALTPDFIQYNAAWGVTTPVSATTNGLMYAVAPVATASLSESVTGAASKVYDGGTAVTGMTLSAPGAYAGDVLTLSGTLAYASKNAGTQAINATGISLVSAAKGVIPVYGYQLQDVSASFTNATITARPMSNWTASVSGNWSNPANWDVMPDGSNVLGVTISSGATVTYDSAVGITHLQSLSSNGTLNLAGGTLDIANQLSTQNYSQSAGVVNGAGSFTVSNSFSQSGGSVTMGGPVTVTQTSGDLIVGNISAQAIALNASNGAISQSAALTSSGLVSTQSSLGTTLNHSGNHLSAFAASSTNGNVALTNTGVFDIQGITTAAGNITVDNTGATRTSALVKAIGGNLTISAHSPLSVGAAGLQASGNITLSAANSDGNLQLDGPVSASSGGVTLSAGASYTQNSAVSAATTVTATAGPSASVTFGSAATTVAPVVTYSVTGSTTPVAPPPTTLTSPPPTIDACTANPATSGCSTILPTLATCTTAPTTAGCSVVLPTLATCTAAPNTAGCTAVLPLISTCIAAPSTAGCSVVLPTLATCTAAQTTPGCADVLAAAKAVADADAAAKAAANAAAKAADDADKSAAADKAAKPVSDTPAPRSQQSVATAANTTDNSNAPEAKPATESEVKKVVMQTVIVANAVVQKPSEEIVRPAQAVGQRLICR